MPPESPSLPPKPEVALALLQTAASVYVHLDPRGEDVAVPSWFKNQPQLVLQIGLNMAVPIPDLDVGRDSISCTLSFNRRPEFCRIPWGAIYGLVGEDGRGMIWPDSVPPEVASAAQGRTTKKPHLRVAEDASSPSAAAEREPQQVSAKPGKPKSNKTRAARGASSARSSAAGSTQNLTPGTQTTAAQGSGGLAATSSPKSMTSAQKPAAAAPKAEGSARRRELPPYLRVVK